MLITSLFDKGHKERRPREHDGTVQDQQARQRRPLDAAVQEAEPEVAAAVHVVAGAAAGGAGQEEEVRLGGGKAGDVGGNAAGEENNHATLRFCYLKFFLCVPACGWFCSQCRQRSSSLRHKSR